MTQYTEHCPATLAVTPAGLTGSIAQTVAQWIAMARLKLAIQRERRQLAQLSDAMLRDIGIDLADAQQEARRRDIPAARLGH